jgi:small basic protein
MSIEEKTMKARTYTDSSFFAKMVLLFALVYLGHPEKRKGLDSYMKSIFSKDTNTFGQIPSAKVAPTTHLPR